MNKNGLDFEVVHRLFAPKVRCYLVRLAGEAEAEDLTQETYIKVSIALGRFRGESSVSTWIHNIAA